MTWQSFKQAPAYPVLVSCPGGHCRGHSLYLLFWHHRHLLGGDRRIHPLGWSAAAAAGRPQRTVGLLPADTSRRVAADPHRWQDDHRHVRRLPRPPRCGRITSNCACHAAGSALRRPWRAASSPGSAHGWRWAATGGLLHRHSAVLPARLAVCHRHRHRLLGLAPASRCCPFFASR